MSSTLHLTEPYILKTLSLEARRRRLDFLPPKLNTVFFNTEIKDLQKVHISALKGMNLKYDVFKMNSFLRNSCGGGH